MRRAIDCLPRQTRIAMLEGIAANPIIVGAYTDGTAVCPMLAAHRHGGRTDFIAFARAWDRFAFRGVSARRRRVRPATERELTVLRSHLEASLLAEDGAVDLRAAVTEHRRLVAREAQRREATLHERATRRRAAVAGPAETPRPSTPARPGDPDRSRELGRRPGWRWMRVARSMDEYEGLLAALEREHAAVQDREALMRELELQLDRH